MIEEESKQRVTFVSVYKGAALNKYEVIKRIGEGATSDVYLCRKYDT